MSGPRVVIIGGGITGLTAAYTTLQMTEQGRIRCTLLESTSRLGGKISTYREDNLVLELGPEALLDSHQSAATLVRDLGVSAETIPVSPVVQETHLLVNGQLRKLPRGTVLGVPSHLKTVIRAPLVTPFGKLRALMDYFIPRSKPDELKKDQSLGLFLRRRLGDEWVDRIAEPLLATASGANLNDMSLEATYPQLLELEHQYRSLLVGTGRERQASGFDYSTSTETSSWSTHRVSRMAYPIPLFTLRNGLQTLTEQLFDQLRDAAEVRTDATVTQIRRLDTGQYAISIASESGTETLLADAVIVATPASVSSQLLCSLSAKAAKLSAIRYVSTATVILGYPQGVLDGVPGSGFLVSRDEPTGITACNIVSRRWPHTSTGDRGLIRCDVGRSGQQEWLGLDDRALTNHVLSKLADTLHLEEKPWFTRVKRWEKAIPQYEVGHAKLVSEVETHLASDAPGIFIAGAGYHGIGVPECIASARIAAEKTIRWLTLRSQSFKKQISGHL
ncbi:protoporphyrinogen oxidase [Alicyclobacillus mengziensis]|uniref:Coproporphyrinogen III oxidase n=1 Tax=Alicyclobacillus mengziensis TaxID=2931921 RepID=A0A9X7VYT1_9BACL|nr:protoporphyrinogen oxidase [Alicyclobacillus mengziensis]QSO46208.1 protoporphyrinogen oxidase [Alicyclobacillus mengziensis]